MMESLTHAYLRLIDKLEVNDKVANCKAALLHQAQSRNIKPEEYMAQHREDIVKIYKQADLSVICDLMDIGYSWRDVMENYANNPMIINEYDDGSNYGLREFKLISKISDFVNLGSPDCERYEDVGNILCRMSCRFRGL